MKYVLLVGVLLAACGCHADSIGTVQSGNKDIHVELIAEWDGIRLYRFYDAGEAIYVTDSRGGNRVSWNTTLLVGKAPVTIHHQTLEVR